MYRLYRSFFIVGGWTIGSRALGFIRDVLIAASFGVSPLSDAFFISLRLPNLFRRLFADGAFTSAFVPLFSKRLESEGSASARAFAEDVFSRLLLFLLLFTLFVEIFMPWFLFFLAPGFRPGDVEYEPALLFSRVMFPYLLCMSIVALLSGMLNAVGRFSAPAAAPLLLNIFLVVILLLLEFCGERGTFFSAMMLSFGVTASGIAQFALLWISLRRASKPLRWKWRAHPLDMSRFFYLAVPSVLSGGMTQVNIIVGTAIASLHEGAVSHLYYAERIYQLPLGVVGVTVGVVLLPELSRHLRAGQSELARESQSRTLEFSLFLALPAAVVCFCLSEAVIEVLFNRGSFNDASVEVGARALSAFALGLPAFILIKALTPLFFAREDSKIPMWGVVINFCVNLSVALALHAPLGAIGIAVATSLAAWANLLFLLLVLRLREQMDWDEGLRTRLPRLLFSAMLMGLSAEGFAWVGRPFLQGGGEVLRFLLLTVAIGVSFLIFLVSAFLFGGIDWRRVRRLFFARSSPRSP